MNVDLSKYTKSNARAAHIRNFKFWERVQEFVPGTVVCITGAGSGIARELSLIYATRGAKLVLCDLNVKGLGKTISDCREILQIQHAIPYTSVTEDLSSLTDHSYVVGCQTNVTVQSDCEAFVQLAISKFQRIDNLILCAGIGAHNVFAETKDLNMFKKCIDVNYYGYLYCTYAAFPYLLQSRGTLTAITSFSGEVGLPYRTAYCASKFAVTGFLESLRSELALLENGGFDIVIVCPPSTSTNLRQNSLTSDSKLKDAGKDDTKSMTVEDCAACIVDATDRKLRKAFFPWSSTIASYVRPLLPDAIDDRIRAKSKL